MGLVNCFTLVSFVSLVRGCTETEPDLRGTSFAVFEGAAAGVTGLGFFTKAEFLFAEIALIGPTLGKDGLLATLWLLKYSLWGLTIEEMELVLWGEVLVSFCG